MPDAGADMINPGNVAGESDVVAEGCLGFNHVLCCICLIAFDIDPQGCPCRARAGKAIDDSAAVFKDQAKALVFG